MFKGILIRLRLVALLIAVLAIALGSAPVSARPTVVPEGEPPNPYYSVETITLPDGTLLDRMIINGPPKPPPGYELERAPVAPSVLNQAGVAASLPVPAYDWVFGCSAVSASMIGAYFDRNGLPNIYTGPTNGGVMPMDNSGWPTWTDRTGTLYPGNPLVASRNGSDGRAIKGSIDDYWDAYESTAQDPYITGGWAQHTWGDAFGDYMKTSQSAYDNVDGSTTFWNYTSNPAPFTCADMVSAGKADTDGTYGRKLFYEARGYSVTECYNQKTDNNGGAFSFASYKAQIDAGYPVLLNLKGHSIVGIGYVDPSTVYIHDTWDYLTHQMTWGGYYSDMKLLSVSVVNLALSNPTPTITGLNPSSVQPGGPQFTLTVNGTDFVNGSVVRWNGSDRTTTYVDATQLTAAIAAADIAAPGTASVTVFNPAPGGGASNAVSFAVGNPAPAISGLNPPSATPGGPGFTLTVNGTNFVNGSVVRWNGSDRTTTYMNATQLTAAITAADIAAPSTAIVTVFSPAPVGGTSNGVTFTVGAGRKVYLPLVVKGIPPAGWTTIVSTDFEGTWPGAWEVFDQDTRSGEHYWGKRNCRAYAGSYSGWGVGGGAQGSTLGCGANYPTYVVSWMVYGPFSLANASAADLSFKLWLNSELDYGGVFRGASINGDNFYGSTTRGNTGGWSDRSFDLTNVYTLGNLLGQPNVWIAIVFISDYSETYPEGGYVDNIVLRKCPTGATCPAGATQVLPSNGQVVESSVHMTLPR